MPMDISRTLPVQERNLRIKLMKSGHNASDFCKCDFLHISTLYLS